MSSSYYNGINTTTITTTNASCSDATNDSSDRSSDSNLTISRIIHPSPLDEHRPMNLSDTDTHMKAVLASHSPPILSAPPPPRKGSSNCSSSLPLSPPPSALLFDHACIPAPPAALCSQSPPTDLDMQPLDLSLRPSRGDHSSKRVGHTMEEHHHRQPHYQQQQQSHHSHHRHHHDHRTAVSQAKYCNGNIGFGNSRGYRLSPYPMDGSRASPPAIHANRSPPLSRLANSPLFSSQRQTPSPAYYISSNSSSAIGGLNSSAGLNGSVPVLGQPYYLPFRPPSTSGSSNGSSSSSSTATTESSSFQLLTTSNNVLNELSGSSALFRPYDGSSDSVMNHVSSSMEDDAPTPPPSREVEEELEEEEEEPTYMDLDSATPRCVYGGTNSSTADSPEYSQRKDGLSQFSPHLHGNHTDAITSTSSPTSSLSFSTSSSSPSSSTSTSSSSRKISPFRQIQSPGTYALRPYRDAEPRIFSKTRSDSEPGDNNDDNPARGFYNLPMPVAPPPPPPPPTSVSEPTMDQQNQQEEALNCVSIADIRLYPGHPQSSLPRVGGGGHHLHRLQFSADSSSGPSVLESMSSPPNPPHTLPTQLATSLLPAAGTGREVGTSSTESLYSTIPQCGEGTSGRKGAPYPDVTGCGGRTTDSESTYPTNKFESPPDNKENAMVGSSTINTSSLSQASSSSTTSSLTTSTATTRTSFFQVATDAAGRKYRSDWEQVANIAATKRSNKSLLTVAAGKEDCQKISLLDFWISKILMERVEAPSKPCNANIRPIMVAGQKKIRLRLIDLIELQVELSLKA